MELPPHMRFFARHVGAQRIGAIEDVILTEMTEEELHLVDGRQTNPRFGWYLVGPLVAVGVVLLGPYGSLDRTDFLPLWGSHNQESKRERTL